MAAAKYPRLPKCSRLRDWVRVMSVTECPYSFVLACGLSTVGAALKRNVWIDQVRWKVWPALRVLLVGPSGVGKDTVIIQSEEVLGALGSPPIVGGRTIEWILQELVEYPPPHVAFLPAKELASFLGSKDYQSGIMEMLTNLLSDSESVLISTKSAGKLELVQPTVTMQCGSTPEWLHGNLPRGALEGGFLPRFLVVFAEYASRHVPLVKQAMPKNKRKQIDAAQEAFVTWLGETAEQWSREPQELPLAPNAADAYSAWYVRRLEDFPTTVRAYAERSRDQVLRIAMLNALTCERRHVAAEDMSFAIQMMRAVGRDLEKAIVPSTPEAKLVADLLNMLPAKPHRIYRALNRKHTKRRIDEALAMLRASRQVRLEGEQLCKTVSS